MTFEVKVDYDIVTDPDILRDEYNDDIYALCKVLYDEEGVWWDDEMKLIDAEIIYEKEKQSKKLELFNVGLGSSISVKDLVKKIINISGKNLKIEHDLTKPSIKTKLCLDITKAKNELGWKPKISLDEGIKQTMNWYEKQFVISMVK